MILRRLGWHEMRGRTGSLPVALGRSAPHHRGASPAPQSVTLDAGLGNIGHAFSSSHDMGSASFRPRIAIKRGKRHPVEIRCSQRLAGRAAIGGQHCLAFLPIPLTKHAQEFRSVVSTQRHSRVAAGTAKVGGGLFYLPTVTSTGLGVIDRHLEDRPPTFISDDN